jgi:hypothetical protein
MILVVDMNWKRDSLAFNEFVSPIVSGVQPLEECTVKHFLDIASSELSGCSKVVRDKQIGYSEFVLQIF